MNVPKTNSLPVVVSRQEKLATEKQNRILLEKELREKRLELTPLPYEAHIQFSNFCNMSCVMCWNGNNPKTRKLTDVVLEKVKTQLGPQLSVLEPFSGSEPLVLTWEETRDMARQYGVLLCLTTNAQYLDEAKFHEVKDITETLYLSIDCHIPEVLEKIRQRANTEKVLRNVKRTAQLAKEHGLELAVNAVLLTHNAPFLADTVTALGEMGIETINVIQMMDINKESSMFDPLTHYSEEYLSWVRGECEEAAEAQKMRLMWNVGESKVLDFRENPIRPMPQKVENDEWDWRMRYLFPGFCRSVYNRIRIDVDGTVGPCCYATEGQLTLGNLEQSDFTEIWNGDSARDLRRGMYTDDVPAICRGCAVRTPPGTETAMPFENSLGQSEASDFFRNGVSDDHQLKILSPRHLRRSEDAPFIEFQTPLSESSILLAMSPGGKQDEAVVRNLEAEIGENGWASFQFPEDLWSELQTNVGYWWSLWQSGGKGAPAVRATEIRCLIRHEAMPRIEGSQLQYFQSKMKVPVVQLGAGKSIGFGESKSQEATEQGPEPGNSHHTPVIAPGSFEQVQETGRLMNRARQLLAYGGLDGVMNRPLMHDSGTYPQFITEASGYHLIDSTGNKFIDWVNGWGSVFLGHANPVVNQAAIEQLGRGTTFGLMNPLEVEVADRLVDLIPCAEKVAFGKNGSDGLNAAIRIARASTGKEIVLQCGFHGFHEWYTCVHENVKGILPVLRKYLVPFLYNDLKDLKKKLRKHRKNVAAVVMEPVNMFMPHEGYLEEVAKLTREFGAVLIFDEVVTAFRLANGGAQEHFGVTPDLACLGKAMGNGLPLSAVVGKRELMNHLPSAAYGMTYRGETVSLAAANAVLKFIQENDVPGHMQRIGERMRREFETLADKHSIRCRLSGPPSRMTFVFHAQGNMDWDQIRTMFVLECLKRGIMTNGNLLLSYAHDDAAVDETLKVFDEVLELLSKSIAAGDAPTKKGVKAFDASAVIVDGFIDHLATERSVIEVGGWMLLDRNVADRVIVKTEDGDVHTGTLVVRDDIATGFPDVANGQNAGFHVNIPVKRSRPGAVQVTLIGLQNECEVFHCAVSLNWPTSGLMEPKPLSDGIVFFD